MEEKYDIKKFLLIKKVYMKLLADRTSEGINPGFAVFAEALVNHEFVSQQELSQYIGCNKAHTSRTLLKMQLRGLVKQSCKTIQLTKKGLAFAKSVKLCNLQLKQQLLKNIPQKDVEVFFEVLDKIIDNANVNE